MGRLLVCIAIVLSVASCKDAQQAEPITAKVAVDSVSDNKGERPYVKKTNGYYKDQVGTTKLKGAYEVYYTTDDSFKYVYLRHDGKARKLNAEPLNVGTFYSLGIVLADFEDVFVLGHDGGNSRPYTVELIDKKKGRNILRHSVTSIDGKYGRNVMVYHDETNKELSYKFVLYNIVTGDKEIYDLPGEIFYQEFRFNFSNMSVDALTKSMMQVSYQLDSGMLTKTYAR